MKIKKEIFLDFVSPFTQALDITLRILVSREIPFFFYSYIRTQNKKLIKGFILISWKKIIEEKYRKLWKDNKKIPN